MEAARTAERIRQEKTDGGPQFLVGTASWTDPTLIKSDLFYPTGVDTPAERLKFYAAHFDTAEVDSTYYTIVSEKTSRAWVDRTPDHFVFNIKAFALLTQHAAETSRLPAAMREILPSALRSEPRLRRPPKAVLDLAFQMFWSALAPLREAGRLGMVLFQFPPYFTFNSRNFDYIAELKERLQGDEIAVEFRHRSWVDDAGGNRSQTLKFLREHGLYYVSVDEPEAPSTVPPILETTGPQAYVRFHGRDPKAWFGRHSTTGERYKYLYSERELAGWAERLKNLGGVRRAFVIFNNCYSNFGIMNATTMAHMLARDGDGSGTGRRREPRESSK